MAMHDVSPMPNVNLHPTLRACWRDEYIQDIEPITEVAFKEAKMNMKSELVQPVEQLWLEQQHSISDVYTLMEHAKDNYNCKTQSKARKWLVALSARILHYRSVLDVFAQHHPEYVSLVWGSFKFLFTAVLNSEKMLKELARSVCQIADVLPRAEVALLLYPTLRMRTSVAHIYKHILRFAQKAIVWYKKGKLVHALHAVVNPWELQFEEDMIAIQEQSRSIEAEASTASRAELREAHLQIYKLQAQLTQMTSIITQSQPSYSISLTTCTDMMQANLTVINRLLPLQETQSNMMHSVMLNQVLSSGPLQHLPGSGKCLEFCMSFRHRRRNSTNYDMPHVNKLSHWASDDKTRILVTRGGDKKLSRDFLVDLITLIGSVQKPVIFALRFPEYRDQTFNFTSLIQMLVAQALQINKRNFGAIQHHLSPVHLQDAVGEEEWLKILNESLRGLPYVFIVLDADLLNFAMSYDRYHASKGIAAIQRLVTSTVLKIFVSSFSIDTSTFGFSMDVDTWEVFETGASRRKVINRSKTISKRSSNQRHRTWR